MANCIAHAAGFDSSRVKMVHRLGSLGARATAATWRTSATVHVSKDGSGWVTVHQDGVLVHEFSFGPKGGQNDSDVRDSAPE